MQVRINTGSLNRVLYFLRDTEGRMRDLSVPLADLGERLVRRIGRRLRGPVLQTRTGRLRASLTYAESPQRLVISAGGKGSGGDSVAYARIHDAGGTIRPKNRKYLTIPFPGGPADKKVMMRARDFTNTFVAKGVIFQKQGKKAVPLFILKRRVLIPKRHYMYVEDSDMEYLKKKAAGFIAGVRT